MIYNKLFRTIAHFVFGIGIGATIGNIGVTWVWYEWIGLILVLGFLLSAGAEFAQAWHYTNVRPTEPNSFQWDDVFKNFAGALVGSVLLTFLGSVVFLSGVGVLGLAACYSLYCIITKRPI